MRISQRRSGTWRAQRAKQNRVHVAATQSPPAPGPSQENDGLPNTTRSTQLSGCSLSLPAAPAASMFGFDCKDPFVGVAPGTRGGELCTNLFGCSTCPNAVFTADAASLARRLQAHDHLRAATGYLHPARREAISRGKFDRFQHTTGGSTGAGRLIDQHFVAEEPLVPATARPHIRVLFIGSCFCWTLLSDQPLGCSPCASLPSISIWLVEDFHLQAVEHARHTF
jgi:hypothetical protein